MIVFVSVISFLTLWIQMQNISLLCSECYHREVFRESITVNECVDLFLEAEYDSVHE